MAYLNLPNRPSHAHPPQKQNGLGMLEVLLFISILGGLAATGYLEWQSRETIKTAREERQSLSQADTALLTFATVNHRLPCPDIDRDGLEDCASNAQKGWLPSLTLQLAGADPGVSTGQLRYLLQRGAPTPTPTFDLASDGDDWRPLEYDDGSPANFDAMRKTTATGGSYQVGIRTLADLCQRLAVGSGTTLAPGMAQVRSSPPRAVAYAVVHPGIADKDNNGSLFEGANATAVGDSVEDPARAPLLADYDDRVLERSFTSLQAAFNCQPLLQSINTVALGLDVIDQVEDMRKGNMASAIKSMVFATTAAVMTGVELTVTVIEAISETGNGVVAGTACGVSLGIAQNACIATGMHVGAAVVAGVTTGANIVVIAANIAAAAAAGAAVALSDITKNAATLTAECPKVDVRSSVIALRNEWNAAQVNRDNLQVELTKKQADLAVAIAARDNAYNRWLAAVRDNTNSSSIDFRHGTLFAAANSWYTNDLAALMTKAQMDHAQEAVNIANDLVIKANEQMANRLTVAAALRLEFVRVKALFDAEPETLPPSALKNELRVDLARIQERLRVAEDPTVLQAVIDRAVLDSSKAVGDRNLAIAANDAAQSTRNTSRTAYENAYAAMLDAAFGQYSVGSPFVATVCSERNATPPPTCPPGSRQTRSNIAFALIDVYGDSNVFAFDSGSVQPNARSRFMNPEKIKREVAALQKQVDDANERVISARKRYDELSALSNNPPVCNITGTGVDPWSPTSAAGLLLNVDIKGGTR